VFKESKGVSWKTLKNPSEWSTVSLNFITTLYFSE
jgi:hypothetical protein